MTTAPHTTGHRIDRNDLLARTNLGDVLDALTPGHGEGGRRAWRCPEPSHPDQHPSVKVFTDRHGIERWRCWSGGHGGTAIDAVMSARDVTVGDAIRWLNENHAHLEPITRRLPSRSRPVGRPAAEVLEYVERCEKLLRSGSGRCVREWLHERGLGDDVLATNRVGADPGRRYLPRPKGLPVGWPAAVYPALDLDGNVTYFQARLIDPPDGRAKYDNPANRWASNPRLAWARRPGDQAIEGSALVVAEGIPDSLTAAQAGFASVAILGSTYPDRRVATALADGARTIGAERIAVCFDCDDAGHAGAHRLSELLTGYGVDVTRVHPPSGLDLSDWAQAGGAFIEGLRVEAPRLLGGVHVPSVGLDM